MVRGSRALLSGTLVAGLGLVTACSDSLPLQQRAAERGLPRPSEIAQPAWFNLRVNRAKGQVSYDARLAPEIYNALVSGRLREGWVELSDVHWRKNKRLMPQSEAASGYSDRVLVRAESIAIIYPLRPGYVEAELAREAERAAGGGSRSSAGVPGAEEDPPAGAPPAPAPRLRTG